MQVPGADSTESFSPVALKTSTRILKGLTPYYEYDVWIVELCEVEAAFIHTNMEVDIYIEWPEGIVDLGIINEEFLREYCILLGQLIYGNVDAELLWLRLFAKYLVNKCNLKRSKSDS